MILAGAAPTGARRWPPYRAAYRHGVSLYSIPYVTFSHQDSDLDETLERLAKAVKEL